MKVMTKRKERKKVGTLSRERDIGIVVLLPLANVVVHHGTT